MMSSVPCCSLCYCTAQGVTYYWPATPEITLGDSVNSAKESFRVLLQFAKLSLFLPPSASVSSARLNLTLVNWQSTSQTVQVGNLLAKLEVLLLEAESCFAFVGNRCCVCCGSCC
jgi:hypothetical protein